MECARLAEKMAGCLRCSFKLSTGVFRTRLFSSEVSSVQARAAQRKTEFLKLRDTREVLLYNRVDGLTDYHEAWEWQKQLVQYKKKNGKLADDFLILLQHPHVFTLGRGSSEEFLPTGEDGLSYELFRTERGGEVTFHCPGQLVGYPLLDLNYYKLDLHWYLRMLEQVVIDTLADFGLVGRRDEDYTGVWVGNGKVCAIGVSVSRWVTMHGFALNINNDLDPFKQIVPCGIEDSSRGVVSIKSLLGPTFTMDCQDVSIKLLAHFERVFNTKCNPQKSWME